MTRVCAGLLALLLLAANTATDHPFPVLLAGVAAANTATDHPYHTLVLTELTYRIDLVLNPQDNYCYGIYSDRILKTNGGAWSLVCDLSDEGYALTSPRRLFFTAAGDLFVTGYTAGVDSLWKAESTDYTVWTSVLEWPCSDHVDNCAFFNHGMCEGGTDTLFVGEYCGDDPDTCATIWRSDDAGDTWTEKFDMDTRHVHGVWWDGLIDSVYATIGDYPDSCLIIGSPDRGENWTVLWRQTTGENGPLSFSARPGIRFWGADAGSGPTDNRVFCTTDDSAFADTLTLSSAREGYVIAMAQDAEGVIYAGTTKKGATGTDSIAIYYRMPWDDSSWYKYDLGTQTTEWRGVASMTEFDASGYAYFGYYDSGDASAIYKFTRSPTYTVGTGGDFATIAAAVASGVVAPGDTLLLLAGTHEAGMDQALPHDVTIRGATTDRTLYTIKNGGTEGDVFDVDSTAVFADLTVRVIGTAIGESFFDGTAATTDVTFDNVAFQGVESTDHPSIFYSAGNGHGVTFEDCRMESCNTSDELVQSILAARFIVRNCEIADNISDEDCQVMLGACAAAHDTVLVSYSLFADNRSEDAGCLQMYGNTDASRQTVSHCTFDNNECDPGGTNYTDGQLSIPSADANVDVRHCVFTGADSTYAVSSIATAGADSILHCVAYGNLRNSFAKSLDTGGVGGDTLAQDPIYNMTGTYATGWYQAKASLVRDKANDYADYMGWELWSPETRLKISGKGHGADGKVGHHR